MIEVVEKPIDNFIQCKDDCNNRKNGKLPDNIFLFFAHKNNKDEE